MYSYVYQYKHTYAHTSVHAHTHTHTKMMGREKYIWGFHELQAETWIILFSLSCIGLQII